ncbi:hypothetical protein BDZ94DRAFT_1310436 [Collybia nuda]|uniref:Uncharacterized protein n=1 Tax=Collybia nuda TaxID=64659 RepID=A0A9P5Y1G7_9AGAR|nr:hypothetical protein BDZ94DRAFT_1310436 [Collybia nuda]
MEKYRIPTSANALGCYGSGLVYGDVSNNAGVIAGARNAACGFFAGSYPQGGVKDYCYTVGSNRINFEYYEAGRYLRVTFNQLKILAQPASTLKSNDSETPNDAFTIGLLYIVGFAQARAPHAGLFIPTSGSSGFLVHIRIDRVITPNHAYQVRRQALADDMACTMLLKLHDASYNSSDNVKPGGSEVITPEQLRACAESIVPPSDDEFGECILWVLRVVEKLAQKGWVDVKDLEALREVFEEFWEGIGRLRGEGCFPT